MIFTLPILLILLALSYSVIPTYVYKIGFSKRQNAQEIYKELYITFDDGPECGYTDKLLDLLLEHDIKATFFIVADKAYDNKDLVLRMQNEGHLIGLHSLEHKNAIVRGPHYTNRDFKHSLSIFNELGIDMRYYRPPWGHFNLFTLYNMRKYHLKPVLWNVMVGDWKGGATADAIGESLVNQASPVTPVICLHDGRGTDNAPLKMIGALEDVIPKWKASGYKFLRLDE